MSGTDAIWADRLSKAYRSGGKTITVFSELTLRVAEGERLAITGASGAGKSTLLHLLSGLDRPSAGRVLVGAEDLSSLSADRLSNLLNRTIGFVWQKTSLLPEFTAVENVAMPLLIRGIPWETSINRSAHLIKEIGLGSRARHRPSELSGGEQQRVAVARALAADPKVLMADEPTGNLDSQSAAELSDLLAQVHRSHGLTSIFVTHSESLARQCDRCVELNQGELTSKNLNHGPWQPASPAEPPLARVRPDATRPDGGLYV